MQIFNEDCVRGARSHFGDETVDLMICDPPFGIGESEFDKHYARKKEVVLAGYVEAPDDYSDFTFQWIEEAARLLKPDGSMYIISGWTHLSTVLVAAEAKGLELINHIVWKYNFGVHTKRKFVTSHYHVLYLKKPGGDPTFNTYCRFGPQEKTLKGKSALFQDMEDVWVINKDYVHDETKNRNKLPESLLEKMILYSSNEGDVVCDFFLGNFTTALVAKKLGRTPWGFELNPNSFTHYASILEGVESGSGLRGLREVVVEKPAKQGKPLSDQDKQGIILDYLDMKTGGMTKKDSIVVLMKKYERGHFSIVNVLKTLAEKEAQG